MTPAQAKQFTLEFFALPPPLRVRVEPIHLPGFAIIKFLILTAHDLERDCSLNQLASIWEDETLRTYGVERGDYKHDRLRQRQNAIHIPRLHSGSISMTVSNDGTAAASQPGRAQSQQARTLGVQK